MPTAILIALAMLGAAPEKDRSADNKAVVAASTRTIAYAFDGPYFPEDDQQIWEALAEGWKLFDGLCGGRMGNASFVRIANLATANVVVLTGSKGVCPGFPRRPADCVWRKDIGLGAGYIRIYWTWAVNYPPVERARFVAHELGHLSLWLPDAYPPYREPWVKDCPMGYAYGWGCEWTGRFCGECQTRVDAIFAERDKRRAAERLAAKVTTK